MAATTHELIGRDEELAEITRLLDDRDALPRTAVLHGAAGIGKTTVWLEASDAAAARGYRVLACRPSEAETRLSYAAVADLLGGTIGEVIGDLPPLQRRALEARRPNHAIQRADTDGNAATSPDASWLPLVTGNHPEYPSGHGCFTAGLTKSLQEHFGTKWLQLTLTSTVTGTTRTYTHLGQLVTDVEDARVWGGLHYRTTMTETAAHFPRIAKDIAKRTFHRTKR